MAKLSKEKWLKIKADYEVKSLSYSALVLKHGVSKTTLSDRVNKEGWVKGKNEPTVRKKMAVLNALKVIEEETELLPPYHQAAIEDSVKSLIRFQNSALVNQDKADKIIKDKRDEELSLMDLSTHSQITARNKEIVLGKSPDTAIQINNEAAKKEPVTFVGVKAK